MTLSHNLQIPDDIHDDVGILLRELHAIPTWTAVKHALYSQFEELVTRKSYVAFTGDCRDYHLERKGQSCLYDVPVNQRGALEKFRGHRVRLICEGAWNQYAGRHFLAKKISDQGK